MRLEGNLLILEREDCHYCKFNDPQGTVPTPKWKTCDKCHGTGKRGNGRCRNCNDRNGYYGSHGRNPGHVIWYDHDDRMPCTLCSGNFKDFGMEDWTDSVPAETFEYMPITVLKRDGSMSWYEQHIGAGLWSSVDYGAHQKLTEDELIQKIRDQLTGGKGANSVQACKIAKSKEDLTICDGLAIVTSDMGYSILPYWN